MDEYLNPEEPGEEMQDAGLSSRVGVTTRADETEGAEVTETCEAPVEDVPPLVASVDKPATKSFLVETPISEVTPPTEAVVIEHVAIVELVSNETPLGEAAEFALATSASAGQVKEAIPLVIDPVLLGLIHQRAI